ncbi:MAG: hypothetical protein KF767_12990 [Bdellovibrionaceae bacterium]|nr:hypothetical protein [Pseudobdellovibrionaceae bacterium]
MPTLPPGPSFRALVLIPLIALWSLGLLVTLNLDVHERRTRLLSENHVLETVSFFVRERQALPLKTALESLRSESGYTRLSLCHRGQLVLAAGEPGGACQVRDSILTQTWQMAVPAAHGYQLLGETRVVTLLSSLCFLLLALSLGGGIFYAVRLWRLSSPARDSRSEMRVKINS